MAPTTTAAAEAVVVFPSNFLLVARATDKVHASCTADITAGYKLATVKVE